MEGPAKDAGRDQVPEEVRRKTAPAPPEEVREARERLDAWTREVVAWHFDPATGSPFWLEKARELGFDPRREVRGFEDLDRFAPFEDVWLRGGDPRRWIPKGLAGRPAFVFETGGSTGVPKGRVSMEDHDIDYEAFSAGLSPAAFPPGADWLSIGPTGPRRLRLAVEHLAQVRGGICFHVDMDPRWVIKVMKHGWMQVLEAYKEHVIDQALSELKGHSTIRCLFTTPKLLEALCEKVSLKAVGITGIFCGGTSMTSQFHRFAREELLEGVEFVPTYGNTLMGLACHKPYVPEDGYRITYYPPSPRAVLRVVDPDRPERDVGYGERGRVKLATLTKETFIPGFLERDEATRVPPIALYPWDGVQDVKPFSRFESTVVEGVYSMAVHLPILRAGRPYRSVDRAIVRDHRTGEPVAEVSQANPGLVARDLSRAGEGLRALRAIPARELIARSAAASRAFLEERLPLDDGDEGPEDYLRRLSATTGLPRALARKNMAKVAAALARAGEVIAGLTRGLEPEALDGQAAGGSRPVSGWAPVARSLGAVLPSNSPGVHTLWTPAVAMKTPLVLKPGREEPWTPHRVIQAFIRAGVPASALSLYPGGHNAAGEVIRRCDRVLLFGDASTVRPWEGDRRIQLHGPGYSKVVLGPDAARRWEDHLDLMVSSILENGGRSCINASAVWTPAHGREIAEALGALLAAVEAHAPEDDRACLAAFPDPGVARRISGAIDAALGSPGAEDVTARLRGSGRLVERHGATWILPTVVRCDDPEHPLANREFLFPYASVVEAPAEEIAGPAGTEPGGDGGHRGRGPAARAHRGAPRRPAEPGAHPHLAHPARGAPRGQPLRAPLPPPGAAGGRGRRRGGRMTLGPGSFEFEPRTRISFGEGAVSGLAEAVRRAGADRVLVVTDPGIVRAGHAGRAREALGGGLHPRARLRGRGREPRRGLRWRPRWRRRAPPAPAAWWRWAAGAPWTAPRRRPSSSPAGAGRPTTAGSARCRATSRRWWPSPPPPGPGARCSRRRSSPGAITRPAPAARDAPLGPPARTPRGGARPGAGRHRPPGGDRPRRASTPWPTRWSRTSPPARPPSRGSSPGRPSASSPARSGRRSARPPTWAPAGRCSSAPAWRASPSSTPCWGRRTPAPTPSPRARGAAHGLAVGILLPHVVRFNGKRPEADARYAELLSSLNGSAPRPEGGGGSASERLASALDGFLQAAGLPRSLREIDVTDADLEPMAREAEGQWTARFNPRPVLAADLLEIYRSAL